MLGPAAEGRRGQAAPHDLAERHQVPGDVLAPVPAGPGHAEARQHLVHDQQRAVLVAERPEHLVEAGAGRHDTHVRGARLGDHAGDLIAARGERFADGGLVVVGKHDGVAGRGTGDAGRVRQAERRDAGPGRSQQGIDVAVIAAGELDHTGPAGEPARQPERGHRGFGAGVDQADLVGRRARGDLLGELDLAGGGGTEGGPPVGRRVQRLHHLRVGVPEDHRAPGAHQVDVLPAVHVGQVRPGTGGDEARYPAHRAERAYRGVDPTGSDGTGPLEELYGTRARREASGGRVQDSPACSQASTRNSSSRSASGSGWSLGSQIHRAAPLPPAEGGART